MSSNCAWMSSSRAWLFPVLLGAILLLGVGSSSIQNIQNNQTSNDTTGIIEVASLFSIVTSAILIVIILAFAIIFRLRPNVLGHGKWIRIAIHTTLACSLLILWTCAMSFVVGLYSVAIVSLFFLVVAILAVRNWCLWFQGKNVERVQLIGQLHVTFSVALLVLGLMSCVPIFTSLTSQPLLVPYWNAHENIYTMYMVTAILLVLCVTFSLALIWSSHRCAIRMRCRVRLLHRSSSTLMNVFLLTFVILAILQCVYNSSVSSWTQDSCVATTLPSLESSELSKLLGCDKYWTCSADNSTSLSTWDSSVGMCVSDACCIGLSTWSSEMQWSSAASTIVFCIVLVLARSLTQLHHMNVRLYRRQLKYQHKAREAEKSSKLAGLEQGGVMVAVNPSATTTKATPPMKRTLTTQCCTTSKVPPFMAIPVAILTALLIGVALWRGGVLFGSGSNNSSGSGSGVYETALAPTTTDANLFGFFFPNCQPITNGSPIQLALTSLLKSENVASLSQIVNISIFISPSSLNSQTLIDQGLYGQVIAQTATLASAISPVISFAWNGVSVADAYAYLETNILLCSTCPSAEFSLTLGSETLPVDIVFSSLSYEWSIINTTLSFRGFALDASTYALLPNVSIHIIYENQVALCGTNSTVVSGNLQDIVVVTDARGMYSFQLENAVFDTTFTSFFLHIAASATGYTSQSTIVILQRRAMVRTVQDNVVIYRATLPSLQMNLI